MKRKLIRFGGALLSVYGILLGRINGAYAECVTGGSHINTNTNLAYVDVVCDEVLGEGYVLNDSRLSYLWNHCTSGDRLFTGSGCDTGWCTASGIFCTGSGYFRDVLNCRENNSSASCYYGTGQYRTKTYYDEFSRCVDGAYQDGAVPSRVPAASGYGFGSGVCLMCSGLRYESGQFITYSPSGSGASNSNDSFYWEGGVGESSCRAFSITPMTNTKGKFTISSDGCKYVES